MGHHSDPGVVQVEPRGDLPIGHHEDVSHPGGVSLHRAQRIAELLVVLEPACGHVLVLFGLGPQREWQREGRKWLRQRIESFRVS